ncbi:right-handed parallel beta-helix repeat-containing protein [bacterium]|nr:right-handed parallel beta-helix repeat-containing protein [bacterium]
MNKNKTASSRFGIATWRYVLTGMLLLMVTLPGHADTTWVAAGSVSGMWHSGNSPYMISEGDIELPADSSLIILEGVEVNFAGAFTFRIYGRLDAEGTEQDSIFFRSDPAVTPGGWRGLRFNNADDASIMNYCVIERGRATGSFDLRYGGGVECQACSPSFSNCTFRNNHANLDGGGVYTREGGAPVFEDCVFESNTANNGGGILSRAQSDPVLANCIFRNNSALSGGGIAVETQSEMSITNCLFEGNSAMLGGGLACIRGTANSVLTNCAFVANSADSSGSAVHLKYTSSLLQHCVFYENEANGANGGTILADTTSARVYNSIIAGSIDGSGIQLNNASGLTIAGCNFYDNEGGVFSGHALAGFGIPTRVNLNFDSCDVHFNIFSDPRFVQPETGDFHLTGNSPCIAGGVNDLDFPADLENNVRPLPSNTFPDQGLFESTSGGPLLLCGALSGTVAPGEYAVICDLLVENGDEFVIDAGTSILFAGDYRMIVEGRLSTRGLPTQPVLFSRYFTENDNRWGGVEFINADNQCDMRYTTIEYAHINAEATRVHGGGIYLDSSSPEFIGCAVLNCEALLAASEGGGIYVGPASDPFLEECTIADNHASLKGGGLCLASGSMASVVTSRFQDNECGLLGGGVYLHQSESSLSNCTIERNHCSGKGGGLYCWWSPAEIKDCFIVDNTCDDQGGGVYVNGSSPALLNCTISSNSAANGGGGILFQQSSAHLKNSIVSWSQGSGIQFILNNAGAVIEFSDIFGNEPEEYVGLATAPAGLSVIDTTNFNGDESDIYFNISADPLFTDTASSNYSLTQDSPCVNAGDPLDELDPDTTIADLGPLYFPIAHNPSTPFNLLSPPDEAGVDEMNLELVWEQSLNQGTQTPVPLYRVQLAEDANFNQIVISQTVNETTMTFSGLADSTTYWWRVLAIGANGIARSSNQWWNVYTVVPHPPTPFALLTPPDQDTLTIIESQLFCWERSYDIDGGDFVVFTLNLESADTFAIFTDLTDTCLNIVPTLMGFNESGIVEWWVEASSNDPDTTIECNERFHFLLQDTTSSLHEIAGMPTDFMLYANYPNPFNAATTLRFDVPMESDITLSIMNVLGQQVAELVSERVRPGAYRVNWNASGFSSGLYLAVLQTDRQRWITKMMMLK